MLRPLHPSHYLSYIWLLAILLVSLLISSILPVDQNRAQVEVVSHQTTYDWVGGVPTRTDKNYDWVGGIPHIIIEVVILGIGNTPDSYGFGVVEETHTYTTGLSYYTVTNNGFGPSIDITINGSDMSGIGVTWSLSDTATPGDAIYGLKCGVSGDYTIVVMKNGPFNTLVTSLSVGSTQTWGLKLYSPTANMGGTQVSGTVTLTATEHICNGLW